MNSKMINQINRKVYKQFPELTGARPKIQAQKSVTAKSKSPKYLLTYRTKASGANGKTILRSVRVVSTPEGKIIKITTSR